jgi:hypothetical protein
MQAEPVFPATIDEAEAQGWQWIGVVCATCRHHTLLPFKLLRRQTRERELLALKPKLYCRRCGFPPDRVALTRTIYPPPYGLPTHEERPFPAFSG